MYETTDVQTKKNLNKEEKNSLERSVGRKLLEEEGGAQTSFIRSAKLHP